MTAASERMKVMRAKRRERGMREIRLLVPDTRNAEMRRRVARQVAALSATSEADALAWIESVSEFDETR